MAGREENEIGEGCTEDFRCVDGQVVLLMFQVETPGGGDAAPTPHTFCFWPAYSIWKFILLTLENSLERK